MERLKAYLIKHFEAVFALVILVSVASINYFIPYKLVFLNFYFIVVLFASYYLELRNALLGGVLCTLIVIVYVYYFPTSFMPRFYAVRPVDEYNGLVQLSHPHGSCGGTTLCPCQKRGAAVERTE